MDIHEAAKQLMELCSPYAPGSWSVGVAEPDTLYLYKHKRGARAPAEFENRRRKYNWRGFTVIMRYIGPVQMC